MLLVVRPLAPAAPMTSRWNPNMDIFWRDGTLIIHADLPGADPQSVSAVVDGECVVISAERHRASNAHDRIVRTGRGFGVAYLRVAAGVLLDADRLDSEYADGVLTVHAYPASPATGARIAVAGLVGEGSSATAAA